MSKKSNSEQPIILFAEECDRGILREENQDAVLHVSIPLGDLLLVADGIGGYTGGATASRMVVENFYSHLAGLPHDYPVDNAIRGAAARANAQIVAAASIPGTLNHHMGSTVVVAVVQQRADGTCAWIGHIGDSRAYLVRAGRLHRITTDHSAVQVLLSRNLITPEEAKNHPDASVLTRSLGHQLEVEIDIEQHPLAVGDTLLLCSDGLWGFVPELDIERTVSTPGMTLETVAHSLLELALAAGGNDNISIEIARMVGLPGAASPPSPSPEPIGHHTVLWVVLTVFMLAFAGFCVIAYFALWRH
ncbi:MAG: protein phosphatase 2C domain-containing protein [Terracidiphilus sp.]|jgi:protein phosphatase